MTLLIYLVAVKPRQLSASPAGSPSRHVAQAPWFPPGRSQARAQHVHAALCSTACLTRVGREEGPAWGVPSSPQESLAVSPRGAERQGPNSEIKPVLDPLSAPPASVGRKAFPAGPRTGLPRAEFHASAVCVATGRADSGMAATHMSAAEPAGPRAPVPCPRPHSVLGRHRRAACAWTGGWAPEDRRDWALDPALYFCLLHRPQASVPTCETGRRSLVGGFQNLIAMQPS